MNHKKKISLNTFILNSV